MPKDIGRPQGGIHGVAILCPDRIVSGSWDETVKIWNIGTTAPEAITDTAPDATTENATQASNDVPVEGEVQDVTDEMIQKERRENTVNLVNNEAEAEACETATIEKHKDLFKTVLRTDTFRYLQKGSKSSERRRDSSHIDALKRLKDLLSSSTQGQKDALLNHMLEQHSTEDFVAVYLELVVACGCRFKKVEHNLSAGRQAEHLFNNWWVFDGNDVQNDHGMDLTSCAYKFEKRCRVKSILRPRGSRGLGATLEKL